MVWSWSQLGLRQKNTALFVDKNVIAKIKQKNKT